MMHRSDSYVAGHTLDIENQCLWTDGQRVTLTPKSFALLCCLYERRPNLVTKNVLLESVWPATRVEEGQVKQFVAELRRLLKDDPSSPRYIENVRGRGYRFIGELELETGEPREVSVVRTQRHRSREVMQASVAKDLPERKDLFEQLQRCAHRALDGQPTLAILTGDPGIGKTTQATNFVRHISAAHPFQLLHSQCLETVSQEEDYAPVLDAMRRVRTGLAHDNLVTLLETHAPSWYERFRGVATDAQLVRRHPSAGEVTESRLQREFSKLIQFMSDHQPLLFWFGDIHLCDPATLHLLHCMVRQPMLGRVLIIATCAPLDALSSGASKLALGQLLCASRGVTELPLSPLDRPAMEAFLAQRWPDYWKRMVHWFAHYTQGNPALMTRIADQIGLNCSRILHCFDRAQAIGEEHFHDEHAHLTDLLYHIGAKYIAGLNDADRNLLQIASVAGLRFGAASLSWLMERPLDEVERQCERLCGSGLPLRRWDSAQRLVDAHDGSYAFSLRICHRALYESVAPNRRARIHLSMAAELERLHGPNSDAAASAIAHHLEKGGDLSRAVHYRSVAGECAMGHGDTRAAIKHLRHALRTLDGMPDDERRITQRRRLIGLLAMASRRPGTGANRLAQLELRLDEQPGQSLCNSALIPNAASALRTC